MEPLSIPTAEGNPLAPGGVDPLSVEKPKDIDPTAIPEGEGKETFQLSAEEKEALAEELCDLLSAYDMAMVQRKLRWKEISDAYNLVPDAKRSGYKQDAQQLVSELTRSHVNIATSRIVEGLLGMNQLIQVSALDPDAKDEETASLVKTAKRLESFAETYLKTEVGAEPRLAMAAHRGCKLGDAVLRYGWRINDQKYFFRDKNGKFSKREETRGGVEWKLVFNDQVVVWPLHENRVEELELIGERTYFTPNSFRRFAKKIKLEPKLVKEIIGDATTVDDSKKASEEDLEGKDIHVSGVNPLRGEICITELFPQNYFIADRTEPSTLQVFLYEAKRLVLWAGVNPYKNQRAPYIRFPYWIEDGSFWSSGVGHECLWPQAADSALWNLYIDNLKLVGNYVRIIKFGSMAEALADTIGPGYNLVTEDPENDLRLEALGGDLSTITEAMSLNELRAMKGDGITAPTQGFGDPVLKSGASPASINQLIQQAGKRFGQVDRNMRDALSDLVFCTLEVIQQFAPEGLIEEQVSEETAEVIKMAKYSMPLGDLRRTYRIQARAPSAASNNELLKQHLFMAYNLASQHLGSLVQIGAQVIAPANPVGWQELQEDMLAWFHNDLFLEIVDSQEIPNLGARIPKVVPPTEAQQFANQLFQQNQELQQQLAELMQRYESLMMQAEQQTEAAAAAQIPTQEVLGA
jgi:hypothetical protein